STVRRIHFWPNGNAPCSPRAKWNIVRNPWRPWGRSYSNTLLRVVDADVTVPAGQKPGKAELRVVVTDADNHQGQQKLDYHQRQCLRISLCAVTAQRTNSRKTGQM